MRIRCGWRRRSCGNMCWSLPPAPQVQTEKLLQEAWRRAVQAQMLAGRIDATQESLLMQGGLCILQAQSDCTELISHTLPLKAAD